MKQLVIITLLVLGTISPALSRTVGDNTETTTDTLKIGDLCPDFVFKDTTGVEHNLKSLLGKYVYIDVWASWCYPCRKQFPFFEQLQEEFKDKDIVFLGINVDYRDFRWLGDVELLHMKGLQWKIINKDFEEKFKIEYIPRFILLDKQGKILETKMTLPSKPETKEYLKALLE